MEEVINRLPGDLKRVAELIGVEHALLLVEHFGGSYIKVPKCEGLVNEIRDNEIRRLYDTGEHTIRTLALKYHLTDRWVSNILSQCDTEVPAPLLDLIKK